MCGISLSVSPALTTKISKCLKNYKAIKVTHFRYKVNVIKYLEIVGIRFYKWYMCTSKIFRNFTESMFCEKTSQNRDMWTNRKEQKPQQYITRLQPIHT